jgi:hypothetical protein
MKNGALGVLQAVRDYMGRRVGDTSISPQTAHISVCRNMACKKLLNISRDSGRDKLVLLLIFRYAFCLLNEVLVRINIRTVLQLQETSAVQLHAMECYTNEMWVV